MSNLSRRSLVATAAALPALAVPALAVANIPAEPDPIFAAIERFNEADKIEQGWYEVRDDADEAFKAKYGCYYPDAFTKSVREDLAAISTPNLPRPV